MTRFLFASMPAAGHVEPLVPLAHELAARGHSVDWYTGDEYRGKVEATARRSIRTSTPRTATSARWTPSSPSARS